MVRHIVLFKFINPTEETKTKAVEVLSSMRGKIEVLKGLEVGSDFLKSERSFDVSLITTFESREDLEIYQVDEYHCGVVKKFMHEVTEKSVTVDYDF